ncbi:MAG TPA: Gfo/Idh/MocA family oxidoreductase [Actinomycetota bacterium]|nr:Gfo/Idh/MocA family oxidoreductase [Actinomycetota bacterium]
MPPVMPPVRLGIIGLGAISRFYLAALEYVPSMRLGAVCDVRATARASFRGQAACHCDHREMLGRCNLDAAVVAVPNHLHAAVSRDVLEAGLPVCVEKPLATRGADGVALDHVARTRGIPLFTAFHRRYNAAVVGLAEGLASYRSPYRPPELVTVRYRERIEDHVGSDPWYLDPERCGGGCVADNGPNAFDLARLFLGELQVTGALIDRDAQGVDRHALITLRSEAGAAARIELDWSYDGECKEVEVRLADGSVHTADLLAGHRGFKASLWHEYVGVLDDFAASLSSRQPRADGGLPALRLVEAAYEAGRQGRSPSAEQWERESADA